MNSAEWPPGLWAVIVTWNSRDDLLACLKALRAAGETAAVLVVDNASDDGSASAVRSDFPEVTVLEADRNLHFARGANLGLRFALAHGARQVCVLNPDAVPATGALAEMVRVSASDDKLGIVGARLVHPRPAQTSRVRERVVVGALCNLATGDIIEPTAPENRALDRLTVDYVWGCAMLLRAEALEQVGLFDESLTAYFEDADLCLRARAAGWHTATALRAVVVHAGSRAGNQRFAQQMWLRGRNWLRVYWRHAPPAARPRLAVWMWGYRLPQLLWSALVTVSVRSLRPNGRPIRLWR
jgi:N-acetylglucosaminyl-diphospho-decaprenol L-rhamnosyltransferase